MADVVAFKSRIDFDEMCVIMQKTGLVKSVEKLFHQHYIQERTLLFDMWIVLRGDQGNGITKKNLLIFMLAILGIKF